MVSLSFSILKALWRLPCSFFILALSFFSKVALPCGPKIDWLVEIWDKIGVLSLHFGPSDPPPVPLWLNKITKLSAVKVCMFHVDDWVLYFVKVIAKKRRSRLVFKINPRKETYILLNQRKPTSKTRASNHNCSFHSFLPKIFSFRPNFGFSKRKRRPRTRICSTNFEILIKIILIES